MAGHGWELGGGGDSQDYTQTQEDLGLDLDEHTQVDSVAEASADNGENSTRAAEPVPWGRLMRLSGGAAVLLMPRPEQPQGRALNEVTLGRGKMCEVQVPDQRISSKHCRIYCETVSGHLGGTEVYVEDMSANGTWINQDMKLVRGQKRLLHSGDEISLLNPCKSRKVTATATSGVDKGGAEPSREEDDQDKVEVETATFTFINLNRNRGASYERGGSLSVAETLRAGTVPGVNSPVLRSSASGAAGIFGGARKVMDFYDIREMIGHGTSGEVRRAINRTTGKEVAVKVIETRKFALTPGLTPKELVQEAEMLKRVDHEYIIKLEDIFQTEQAVYLVMDLVSGGDLFDRIVEKGVYEEDLAQELLFRVLTAVDYLHSQDIVHRDLKPENILLVGRDNDVDVKITDFGLAKRANKEGLKTFCGTPQYFAPEVLKRRNTVLGVGRYGKEADMWSVGVILYILLSGTHPFHTTTLFDQITHALYSMTGEEWKHISATAKDLVSKLLTENPDERLTANQALAHPFITGRAAASSGARAAKADTATGSSAATAAAAAGGTSYSSAEAGKEKGGVGTAAVAGARGAPPVTATTAAAAKNEVSAGSKTRGRGHAGSTGGMGGAAAAGRSFSQETDLSSTSGGEDATPEFKESYSPTEGGGGSAKAVPSSETVRSPKDGRSPRDRPSPKGAKPLPPRGSLPDLPPPQPRVAAKDAGPSGPTRVRKRAKKDGAGDKQKPPPPYSQLQVVRVNGSDQAEGGGSCNQDTTSGAAGAHEDSKGVPPGSSPAGAGSATSGNGRGEGSAAEGKVAPRSRGKPCPNGPITGSLSPGTGVQPKPPPVNAGAGCSANGREKPKVAVAGVVKAKAGVTTAARASTPTSSRRGAGAGGGAVSPAAGSLSADDEIVEYSSDDSPAKGKRARVCRGRQKEAASAASAARPKPATAMTGRGRASVAGTPAPSASALSSVAPAPVEKRAAKSNARAPPPSQQHQQRQRHQQRQLRETKGGGVGSKQMHLNFGDSGKLNLSKLGPLSRVGAGSAASSASAGSSAVVEWGRASGDQAAHAAAGGAAAMLEDAVGGGGPAGGISGGASSGATSAGDTKAGDGGGGEGGITQPKAKGGSKPQRTMTHLWKRAGTGKA